MSRATCVWPFSSLNLLIPIFCTFREKKPPIFHNRFCPILYLYDWFVIAVFWMNDGNWLKPSSVLQIQSLQSITTHKHKLSTPKWAFINDHTLLYVYHWIHLVQIICFAISDNEITSIKYSKNTKIYKKIISQNKFFLSKL